MHTDEQLNKLDRLVGAKVMGWKTDIDRDMGFDYYWGEGSNEVYCHLFKPTRNIAHAWQCLEAIRLDSNGGVRVEKSNLEGSFWCCDIWNASYKNRCAAGTDESKELAIVIACLEVVGVNIEKEVAS